MEVEDMLDVVHTLYELDAIPMHEDHHKIKSKIRSAMWENLYEKEYPYPYDETGVSMDASPPPRGLPPEETLLPPEPGQMKKPPPLKPYIPPTDPADFGDLLDKPLR
jgi:hypothetical protein